MHASTINILQTFTYFSLLGLVCLAESGLLKTTFQTFPCLFAIRKISQWKTLSNQRKIWLGFQENVFFLF